MLTTKSAKRTKDTGQTNRRDTRAGKRSLTAKNAKRKGGVSRQDGKGVLHH